MISDNHLSDRLDDAGPATTFVEHASRDHRDGLVRGIVFLVVMLAPFVATFGPSVLGNFAAASHAESASGVDVWAAPRPMR